MFNQELNKITRFNKDKELTESADMIVCCIDKKLMKLTYSSAKMRAFIIRDGQLILLEKDKCSIGSVGGNDFKIINQSIDLMKHDCLYIATDGLSDQLGGVRNRCIGFKHIREMIYKLNGLSMATQKQIIEDTLMKWQRSNDQTDDITVFGMRI
jgi:sigma-B regulation protein RsbU (phosphoserine phosphatase)